MAGGCHASGSGACSDLVHTVGATLLLGRLRSMAWLGFSTPRRGGVRITDQSRSSHALNPLELSTRNRTQIPRWASACDSPCVSTVVIAHATIFEMDGEFLICAN